MTQASLSVCVCGCAGLSTSTVVGSVLLPRRELNSPNPEVLLPLLLPFLPWGPVVDGARTGTLGRPLDEIAGEADNTHSRGVFSHCSETCLLPRRLPVVKVAEPQAGGRE